MLVTVDVFELHEYLPKVTNFNLPHLHLAPLLGPHLSFAESLAPEN